MLKMTYGLKLSIFTFNNFNIFVILMLFLAQTACELIKNKPISNQCFKDGNTQAMKVKNDHHSKFSNLSNWKEEA